MAYVFAKMIDSVWLYWIAPFHSKRLEDEWVEDPLKGSTFNDEFFYRGGYMELVPDTAEIIRVVQSSDPLRMENFWKIYRDESGKVTSIRD